MSALSRSRQLQPGSKVRWDRLERDAFSARPEVLGGVTASSATSKKKPAPWEWPLLIGAVLVAAVAFGSPIWGYVAIAADDSRFARAAPDSDPNSTIPVAGAFFACAFIVLVALIVAWFARRRPKSAGFELGFAGVTLVLGAMTALAVWRKGVEADVVTWQMWIIPVVAATVLSGIYTFALTVRRLRHQSNSKLSFDDADLLEASQRCAAELDSAEQADIRADLDAAIADLEQRGIITRTVAEQARQVELGGLALNMKSGGSTTWRGAGR